ncbi:thioesterase domain-containing protein [Herminiimonas fonticola]|uniref:thioesterase domain-containing protein n=1 Tax=Herminiimonas fonticola TaxID=303380 RepID=UPI00333F824B
MNEQTVQQYLYDHIPLSRAMQVEVSSVQPNEVILSAPLAPNINHQETVFGGSASAVAILAAWSLLHVRLNTAGIASRLVIQGNTMQYELPISGTFTARAYIAEPAAWQRFVRTFERRGRARISVTSVLEYEGRQAGILQGEFVALAPEAN